MLIVSPQLFQVLMVVLASLLTFVATRYWTHRSTVAQEALRAQADFMAMLARIETLEKQLAVVGQAVVPISAVFQQILIKELTHIRTPRVDLLLTKLGPPYMLTADEETELSQALEQRVQDLSEEVTASERDAARMLPLVIKRVKMEFAALVATALTFKSITEENQRLRPLGA